MDKPIREHTTARINVDIIKAVKKLADEESRSYSNMLETLLKTHPKLKQVGK